VQATFLRSLMVERHALIQRLVEPDAQRGQLLTLATLGAADAILSADAAALRQAIAAASTAAQRRRSARHESCSPRWAIDPPLPKPRPCSSR